MPAPKKKPIPWWLNLKKNIPKKKPTVKRKGFNMNNIMHQEATKPPAGLQNRIVIVWSPPEQKYNYSPVDHSIVTKIGKEEFDIMLAELAIVRDYRIDENFKKEDPGVGCYICCSFAFGLCCCAFWHVIIERVKRMKARKDRLAKEFNNYYNNNFAKKGLKLSAMWAQHGGWWYISDQNPDIPNPLALKPAPGSEPKAPWGQVFDPITTKWSCGPTQPYLKTAKPPVEQSFKPGIMKPQAMPTHYANIHPGPMLPPDETLRIEQIYISYEHLPAAGLDYDEMMFGISESDDSDDMP